MSESIKQLEEKIAYLERHVTQQDKAMLEMADDIVRLRREMKAMRDAPSARSSGGGEDETVNDDRPPHY